MATKVRHLWVRKPAAMPSRVLLLEPKYYAEEFEPGRYDVRCDEWLIEYLTAGKYVVGGFRRERDVEKLVDQIVAMAECDGRAIVVALGMGCVIRLLGLSIRLRNRGFLGFSYCVSSRRAYIECRRGPLRIIFCDIRNWLVGEIDDMARWVGLTLPPTIRWWPDETRDPLYHPIVLEVMARGLQKYFTWADSIGLAGWSYGLSAGAFGYWSRQDESRDCQLSFSAQIEQRERLGYHGGFCQAHRSGHFKDGPFFLLDFNGLYASIMAQELLPSKYFTWRRRVRDGDLFRVSRMGEALVFGRFELSNGFLPAKTGKWTTWTHGPIDCWLPWPEVCWCHDHGTIHEVFEIIVYRVGPILQETARHFLKARHDFKEMGMNYDAKMSKMACNSIYGKLAQRFGESVRTPASEDDADGVETMFSATSDRMWQVITFCGAKIVTPQDGGGSSAAPVVSAWVTSHARVRLWKACSKAGWENVLYNDTDSLIVNAAGYLALKDDLHEDEPGCLSREEWSVECEIKGPKQYSVGRKSVDSTVPNMVVLDGTGGLQWMTCEAYSRGRADEPDTFRTRLCSSSPVPTVSGVSDGLR